MSLLPCLLHLKQAGGSLTKHSFHQYPFNPHSIHLRASMPDSSSRRYGITMVGASGFTVTHVYLHIGAKLHRNLQWAISGRSQDRLEKLAARLRENYPDRVEPSKVVCCLSHTYLTIICIRKTPNRSRNCLNR